MRSSNKQLASNKAFVRASGKKKRRTKRRSKTPISNPKLLDINKNEILQKYPLYKRLKMAHLGIRPKKIPLKTVLRFIEEIYEKISKLSKRKFSLIFREQEGFSNFAHDYFESKFDQNKTGNLKKCEHTIVNFLYSIEQYKSESLSAQLFGQILAEMYGSDLTIFVTELRISIQDEMRKKILKHLEKRPNLKKFKIPYRKLGQIIGMFLAKGTMEHSIESFMTLLVEKYPEIKVKYCLEYEKFLHFSADLFIHKRQIEKGTSYDIQQVMFVDDYDAFKTKNMEVTNEEHLEIREACKFKIAELSEKFVNIIMEDATITNYHTSIRLKGILTGLLRRKAVDLISALCNEDHKGWMHLLLIESPSMDQKAQWEAMLYNWRNLCASGPTDNEITEFVKQVLQNKKLVDQFCKLVIYLTSRNI